MSLLLTTIALLLITVAWIAVWFVVRNCLDELRERVEELESKFRKYEGPECLKGGTTFLYRLKTEDTWRCDDPSCHRTDCPHRC